jgi:hypothetical protein
MSVLYLILRVNKVQNTEGGIGTLKITNCVLVLLVNIVK